MYNKVGLKEVKLNVIVLTGQAPVEVYHFDINIQFGLFHPAGSQGKISSLRSYVWSPTNGCKICEEEGSS